MHELLTQIWNNAYISLLRFLCDVFSVVVIVLPEFHQTFHPFEALLVASLHLQRRELGNKKKYAQITLTRQVFFKRCTEKLFIPDRTAISDV